VLKHQFPYPPLRHCAISGATPARGNVQILSHVSRRSSHDRGWLKAIEKLNLMLLACRIWRVWLFSTESGKAVSLCLTVSPFRSPRLVLLFEAASDSDIRNGQFGAHMQRNWSKTLQIMVSWPPSTRDPSHVSCLVPPSHVSFLNKRGVWGFHSKIQAKSAAQADRLSEIRFPGRRRCRRPRAAC
jgi:hypothetical protein